MPEEPSERGAGPRYSPGSTFGYPAHCICLFLRMLCHGEITAAVIWEEWRAGLV